MNAYFKNVGQYFVTHHEKNQWLICKIENNCLAPCVHCGDMNIKWKCLQKAVFKKLKGKKMKL